MPHEFRKHLLGTGAFVGKAAVLADSERASNHLDRFGILLAYSFIHRRSFLPIR
jgi:hypothetical protein